MAKQLAHRWPVPKKSPAIPKPMNDNFNVLEPKRDAPESYLSVYFREMAPLPVLQPEQEFEAARKIEDIEIELWKELLGHPQLVELSLNIVERGLENSLSEFALIRRRARGLTSKDLGVAWRRYDEQCDQLAKRIHTLDVDRRLLFAVVAELRVIAHGGRSSFGRVQLKVKSKAFRAFFSHIRALYSAAQRARNEFIKSNLRLVVSIARRFNHGRMPLSDLIQEGNIGLIKAVERYDYRRGYRFSTYASWWIRHAISRALADKGRSVRLPVHMLDAYHKVARTSRDLSSKLGRDPTVEEIGASSNLATEKVEKIQGYLLDQSLSLDRTVSGEDDRRFIELLMDPEAMVPTEKILERSVSEQVRDILTDLKPIEADVLRKRFGLSGEKELTLKEIGDSYSLSRERIRQIQEQSLLKIRRALQRRDAI
jgi:RNA polymerase primary sigma factor